MEKRSNLIKAEILFTRKCNIGCKYCNMIRDEMSEMSIADWCKGLDAMKNLGLEFMAIYGAEPLLVFDKLCRFIEEAEKRGISQTIITNALLIDDEKIEGLKRAGLTSITVSADRLYGGGSDSEKKAQRALDLLDKLVANFEDVEVSACIMKTNRDDIPSMIEYFTERDIWFSYDFIHWDNGKLDSKTPVYDSSMNGLRLSGIEIRETLAKIIEMKQAGYKIHQTVEAMQAMQKHSGYDWLCKYPYFVTVDADGTLRLCDDCTGPNVEKFSVTNLDERWDEFVAAWTTDIKTCCPGCMWSTHIMSEQMWADPDGKTYFKHFRGT